MKDKIYKNREVLRGLTILTVLSGGFYNFKIQSVNEKGINISCGISYDELNSTKIGPVESILKKVIAENNSNYQESYSRRAFLSSFKLKKIPIIVDGIEFNIDNITNSKITIAKLISYDELENCEERGFISVIKRNVKRNLLDNPPKILKHESLWSHHFLFDLFDFVHTPRNISEEQVEKNRIKYKKQRDEENRKRIMAEQLDKELNLDKKNNTRELARFR